MSCDHKIYSKSKHIEFINMEKYGYKIKWCSRCNNFYLLNLNADYEKRKNKKAGFNCIA